MILYASTTSPFVRKVMIVAFELGLEKTITVKNITTLPTSPNAELGTQNPLSKIPALVTQNQTLVDSRVICEFLCSLKPQSNLYPTNESQKFKTLSLQALADGALDAGILYRYETTLRPTALHWPLWLSAQEAKVKNTLTFFEKDCPNWQDSFDIGQIAVFCALGWLDFRKPFNWNLSDFPRLHDWYARRGQLQSTQKTKPYL